MTVKITRLELTPGDLRREAAGTKDARAARRMLAIALLLEGQGREPAARQSAMERQTLRDWVHRYNAEGIAGLFGRPHGGGAPRKLTAPQESEVAGWVRAGPVLETDGVVRWRRSDLGRKIAATFGVHLHERSVGKLLHRLGFRHLSVRPRHPQADPSTQEAHKKTSPHWWLMPLRRRLAASQSNSGGRMKRASAKGSLTYIWGKQGTRPAAPRDQRYDWAYIFGAVCPARGVGAALVLPDANAEAMNLHLNEISRHVTPGAHAVVLLDGAGWHQLGGVLRLPHNISLLHLPPYSPELNPVENIWQFLRQNFLSNRVYDSYDAIVDACCHAWNALIALPERIRSITQRSWAIAVNP